MYEGRYTETFVNRLTDGDFRQQRDKIRSKCEMILKQPYGACKSEPLKYAYRGKRSGRVDQRYRIIYTICEECFKQGLQEVNLADCPGCEDIPMKTVTFLDITDHYRVV